MTAKLRGQASQQYQKFHIERGETMSKETRKIELIVVVMIDCELRVITNNRVTSTSKASNIYRSLIQRKND